METTHKRNLKPAWILMSLAMLLFFVSNVYAYKSMTSRENSVTVDVRPEQLASGQSVRFMVRLNTHSVNLAVDMVTVSELKDSEGRVYQPVNWEGSPPGGHHRSGILEFPKLEGNPESVTLVIRNISNVPERVFQWTLE